MTDCLFCKIVARSIPSNIVFEDDNVLAFEDINPKAPVHILIIPKLHIATINDISSEHDALIGQMYLAAKTIAKEKLIADDGYRVVMNCNKHGGQEVYHIHLHLLGGKQLTWPPGC
jgi:histidine triad (HIT) family protein